MAALQAPSRRGAGHRRSAIMYRAGASASAHVGDGPDNQQQDQCRGWRPQRRRTLRFNGRSMCFDGQTH